MYEYACHCSITLLRCRWRSTAAILTEDKNSAEPAKKSKNKTTRHRTGVGAEHDVRERKRPKKIEGVRSERFWFVLSIVPFRFVTAAKSSCDICTPAVMLSCCLLLLLLLYEQKTQKTQKSQQLLATFRCLLHLKRKKKNYFWCTDNCTDRQQNDSIIHHSIVATTGARMHRARGSRRRARVGSALRAHMHHTRCAARAGWEQKRSRFGLGVSLIILSNESKVRGNL